MSYLLFMDESGHDHRTMPYEVRGGVALHANKLWPFVQAMRSLEESCFGDLLHRYKSEIKGHKLLDKDRFKWASQDKLMDDVERRKHAIAFLNRGTQNQSPKRQEFTAYGQASLAMARGVFQLLVSHEAVLFVVAIPREAAKPETYEAEEYLRKDHVFLLERYYYFLEKKNESGLLVLDETDKTQDRVFVRRLERYFTRTQTGRYRASRIVPTPFFVSSDMTYAVQAADICLYCLNWGFRLPASGMNEPVRQEIAEEFAPWLHRLKFGMDVETEEGKFRVHGIRYVADPYEGSQK
ncbi:MAG: DUF3800 domain-containing protein [Terriglobales bacterium]|jgi:hypothetical protein